MASYGCHTCQGSGWVCEAHPDRPSAVTTTNGCACCAPAENCDCNPDGEGEMTAVYAAVDPSTVKEWIQ